MAFESMDRLARPHRGVKSTQITEYVYTVPIGSKKQKKKTKAFQESSRSSSRATSPTPQTAATSTPESEKEISISEAEPEDLHLSNITNHSCDMPNLSESPPPPYMAMAP